MKAFTPEISWHNRLPALSLDVSPHLDQPGQYRVATGGNDCRVYIWSIGTTSNSGKPDIRIRAGLRRHQKSIGAVRFSHNHMLASGDDDGYIYLWKHKVEDDQQELQQCSVETNAFLNDDGFEDLEVWKQQRVLRGHIEDICDLAWSKDGQFLLSGSVDNSAILWDTLKGTKVWCSDLIKGYVQGVALDPHSQYMAALSSDRTLRIYNFSDKRLLKTTRRINIKNNYKAFFCDDTVQTFCRRFDFSPDGQFLLAPTSRLIEKNKKPEEQTDKTEQVENQNDPCNIDNGKGTEQQSQPQPPEVKKKPINALLVFKRSSFNKPVHYYPTGTEVALCARFSPVVYKLRKTETNFWDTPYRIVFAIATSRSILIYDSQQSTPIGYASQIHLARITDLAWSSDGCLLMITSYDGYSTLITFEKNEFGEVYTEPLIDPTKAKVEEVTIDSSNANGTSDTEVIPKKGQKRFKTPRDTQTSKKEKLIDESCSDDEEKSKVKVASTPPKRITPTLFKYFSKRA